LAHSSGGELPIYLPQENSGKKKKKPWMRAAFFSGAKFHTVLKKIVETYMIY
jgi:hypothetical protein